MPTHAFKVALLTALLYSSACMPSIAQVPAAGYWVVETNEHTKDRTTVQFYDAADQLVYEERLEGLHLDVTRRKTARILNRTLQRVMGKSLIADQMKKDNDPVAARMVKKRS